MKQKESEIEKLRADSKEVTITETSIGYFIDEWKLRDLMGGLYVPGFPNRGGSSDINEILRKLNQCIVQRTSSDKKQYFKNLNEVQKDIRDQLELEYQEEIKLNKIRVKDLNDKIIEVREEEKKKSIEAQKALILNNEDLKTLLEEEKKKYKELEEGKKELSEIESLEWQLKEMTKLYQEKCNRKGFFQRLFS